MGEVAEALKNLLETEEGKKSWEDWEITLRKEQEVYNNQLQRAFNKFGVNISNIVEKIIAKYDSDKYRYFWWKKGCEPPEDLYFFLFDYAQKYGVVVDENSPIEQRKLANMFTSEMYYLDGYVFNKINGQGTCVLVEKVIKKEVVLLSSDDWMGLYVDNEIIEQCHSFDIFFLLQQSEELGFKYSDIKSFTLEEVDFDYVYELGRYPDELSNLRGKYY